MGNYPVVCIEGIDASGKQTHSKALAEHLHGTRISFPAYQTDCGEAIEASLKDEWEVSEGFEFGERARFQFGRVDLNSLVFQCLQTVNRLEIMPEILAAREQGPVVLDRYWISALVYGSLDGLDPAWIRNVHSTILQPDLWILLDVDADHSRARRPERRDRYEREASRMVDASTLYRKIWIEERKKVSHRWAIVDARGSVEETFAQIKGAVGRPIELAR